MKSRIKMNFVMACIFLLPVGAYSAVCSSKVEAFEENRVWGYRDAATKIVLIQPQFESARMFCEDLAAVKLQSKWGYLDYSGNFAIPAKYEAVTDFSGGLAVMKQGVKWGVLDKQGTEVCAPSFNSLEQFSEGLSAAGTFDPGQGEILFGFIDTKCGWKIPPQYKKVQSAAGGIVAVSREGQWSFLNLQGNEVSTARYEFVKSIGTGWGTSNGDKWGYVRGETFVLSPRFEQMQASDTEAAVGVKVNGKWGVIDAIDGRWIAFGFVGVNVFSEGLAPVQFDSGFTSSGYIDRQGKTAIAPQFFGVEGFVGSKAVVHRLIDRVYVRPTNGSRISPPTPGGWICRTKPYFINKLGQIISEAPLSGSAATSGYNVDSCN